MSELIAVNILGLTAQIVSAHLSNNPTETATLPALIHSVYRSLSTVGEPQPQPTPTLTPAVPVKKSVFPDHIVCLEDGKKLKMLKRHLRTSYGMTPEAYRTKWGLPSDYPMVAPSYAAKRSSLAKEIGLGRKPAAVTAEVETEAETEIVSAEPEVTKLPTRRARGSKG
jgi:predicted transcriptional regulator